MEEKFIVNSIIGFIGGGLMLFVLIVTMYQESTGTEYYNPAHPILAVSPFYFITGLIGAFLLVMSLVLSQLEPDSKAISQAEDPLGIL